MELVTNPCLEKLLYYIGQCRHQLCMLSPYIKLGAIHPLMKHLAPHVQVQLITRVRLADYYHNASDLSALRIILDNEIHMVRSHPNLHAKVYLIDDQYALITSANLTFRGLTTNYEYGVLFCESEIISQIQRDFTDLWEDISIIHDICTENLEAMQAILSSLPPLSKSKQELVEDDGTGVLQGLSSNLRDHLSNWEQLVFDIIDSLPGDIVHLEQLKPYEENMKRKYPGAQTPLATARRVLQELRDKGLLEFVDNRGTYRKLWS